MSEPSTQHNAAILEARELTVCVEASSARMLARRPLRTIVDHVSFRVTRGTTLAIVGESGSGKSTIARALIGSMPIHEGTVHFDGVDLLNCNANRQRELRARIQIIFQDPYSSMNPRHTIEEIVTEPLIVHRSSMNRDQRRSIARELLELCGMPSDSLERYPHQFSGGQRQRIAIARALVLSPDLVICDEPTSALDVSVRSQIINLLMDLKSSRGVSYIMISHDMATVRHMADDVLVLKSGKVVETGTGDEVFTAPKHEYTKALIEAVPVFHTVE